MNDKIDPVMKLANHRPPMQLPDGWSIVRQDDGDIIVCGPFGGLTMTPDRQPGASLGERLLFGLAEALLAQTGAS